MKRSVLICLLFLFLLLIPVSSFAAEEAFDSCEWYVTKKHVFSIPMSEEFDGSTVELSVDIGYYRECAGGFPKLYFDKMISYDISVKSDNEEAYIESEMVSFFTSGYKQEASVFAHGVVTEEMPVSAGVIPPKSGPLKFMNWTMSTKWFVREDFNATFELNVW